MSRIFRSIPGLVSGIAVVIFATSSPASSGDVVAPASMASLGDSLTRGFNACGWMFDCTSRSWTTGDSEVVDSHYLRLLALNPKMQDNAYNNARSGAESGDLPAQAARAVSQNVDYVTILIGANDICADTEAEMTDTATFRSNIDRALATVGKGIPKASVFVASVPNVVRLWQIGYYSVDAKNTWELAGMCPTVLSNPDSLETGDVERRRRVAARIDDYNLQLEQACTAYGVRCRYDGGAVHDFQFTMDQISQWDFFHLNKEGQQAVADLTWRAGFTWGQDPATES